MQTVVIGGGYAGLRTVQTLAAMNLPVTLVEPRREHVLRPRLVAAAAGRLALREVSLPYERLLPAGVRHLQATALQIDPEAATVETDYETLRADRLVIAVGSEGKLNTSGAPRHTLPLYSLEDLERILAHWSRLEDALKRDRCDLNLLRWVIVGGGIVGVELAAELSHLARRWRQRYGGLAEAIQIHLIQRQARLLSDWPEAAGEWALRWLKRHRVIVQTASQVRRVRAEGVVLETSAGTEELASQTVFWTGGIQPVRLEEEPAELRRDQFLRVDSFLRLVDYPHVYAVGDSIRPFNAGLERTFAPNGQLAVRAGELVAANIASEARGGLLSPFVPRIDRIALSLGAFDGLAVVDGQVLTGTAGWTVAQAADLFYFNAVQNPLLARMAPELFSADALPGRM
ncbi:NAD(P)/FAD-dependent oxidoreductase [Gloeobacter kilaueensis]|uniref:NADH dehydrogenase n=1 Tax=Gloeobacter kilaueensis (strain ATCC BAA-2537 / CCAP 1431/1 / ULC 316 / JS1) TaxID=1183438 RepID=U5QJ51_GLOK1|nr:FAD-dependent oxidoreductase [Gloeobacter kilaueensis]AGY57654.1 NADH dehydrogenase [Gloeobacter kilaueensis JS1]